MKIMFKFKLFILIVFSGFIFSSCGYLEEGADEYQDIFYSADFHRPGDAVAGLPYKLTKTIKLFLYNNDTQTYVELSDGDLVDITTPAQFMVQVDQRTNADGEVYDQRIVISDGGESADYYAEALYDESAGGYICNFPLNSGFKIIHPILVQVLYPDQTASKKKVLLATKENIWPDDDQLIQNGLGITVSDALLGSLEETIIGLMSSMMPGAIVTEFGVAKSGGNGILYLSGSFPILGLQLPFETDLILQDSFNDNRELALGADNLLIKPLGIPIPATAIAALFNLFPISLGPMSFPLGDMLSSFAGSGEESEASESDGAEDMMAALMQDLNIDTTLFLNAVGLPNDTNDNFAAIGASLFPIKSSLVPPPANEDDPTPWPAGIDVDPTDPLDAPFDMSRLNSDPSYDVGVALSAYWLNQLLGGIAEGLNVTIGLDILGETAGNILKSPDPSKQVKITISMNKKGIALDMTDPEKILITINDLQLETIETEMDGNSGIPKTLFSADISLYLKVDFISTEEGGLALDLKIEPLFDLCHVHVLKDNSALAVIDHSGLVRVLLEQILEENDEGELGLMFPLGELLKLKEDVPTKIERDENGNCFMSLAVDDFDPSSIFGDSCFISTASL